MRRDAVVWCTRSLLWDRLFTGGSAVLQVRGQASFEHCFSQIR